MFAALLRDNIKRMTISGMKLPQGRVSQKYPASLDKSETHTAIQLYIRERMINFNPYRSIRSGNLLRWEDLDRFLCAAIMSGGERVGQEVTHRRENFEDNGKEVASTNHQEVGGGALNNVIEKGLYTRSMHTTSLS